MIILREKDLNEEEFLVFAKRAKEICEKHGVFLSISMFFEAAKRLSVKNVHLSFKAYIENQDKLDFFEKVGVSVHSLEEALKVNETKRADYALFGHIFETDCKKGLAPRGVLMLREICERSRLPVFAIGGIKKENVKEVLQSGAKDFCIMSELMECENPYDKCVFYNNLK